MVPYPAGGVVDPIARTVGEEDGRLSLKQPIIVEAKPGANANIGAENVARSPADGYHLLMVSPFLATNPLLAQGVRWKAADFTAIGLIGAPPNLFVVPATLPVRSLKELVDYTRQLADSTSPILASARPITSVRNCSSIWPVSTWSMSSTRVNPRCWRTSSAARSVSGWVTEALAAPHIKDGKLRALAIGAPRRAAELPDVPTVAEAGYPDASFLPWFGVVAPAATPRDVVRRLSDELHARSAAPRGFATGEDGNPDHTGQRGGVRCVPP